MLAPQPNVKTVLAPVAADMAELDRVIRASLYSEVSLINQISDYIIAAGGKRLRPALVLLLARAFQADSGAINTAVELAAIVEFIHTATLLHDDVVDESTMRRGRLTANAEYGNQAAVLVGDFLYSRSFQMMTRIGILEVMNVLADTTNVIAEGEVLQLLNCKDPDVTEDRYMKVIEFKTAKLFEASAKLAAIATKQNDETIRTFGLFGAELGTAFQLTDDVLDYAGDSASLGKNVGDDLREGKPTLPLIHAMRMGSPEIANQIRLAITNGGTDQVDAILAAINQSGSLEYTLKKAIAMATGAKARLQSLTPSPFKTALETLCDAAVHRQA